MRNRRFQSSCGQEVMGGGGGGGLGYGMPMMAPPPMMYGGMMMPQQPMMMMGPMMPPQPQVGMRQGSMMPQQANPIPEMDDLQVTNYFHHFPCIAYTYMIFYLSSSLTKS